MAGVIWMTGDQMLGLVSHVEEFGLYLDSNVKPFQAFRKRVT